MEAKKYQWICNTVITHRDKDGTLIAAMFVKMYDEDIGPHGREHFAGPFEPHEIQTDADGNEWVAFGKDSCLLREGDAEKIRGGLSCTS